MYNYVGLWPLGRDTKEHITADNIQCVYVDETTAVFNINSEFTINQDGTHKYHSALRSLEQLIPEA